MAGFVAECQWSVLLVLATLRSGWASCEMVASSHTIPGSCAAAGISTCCSGDACNAAAGCQCDSSCFEYGDCCSDIFVVCPYYLAPANVAIYNVTETTVTVNWTMQYITQDELFQVILSNSSLSNSTQSFGVTPLVENCMYSIVVTGLEPSTAYKIQIAASHAAGQSISEHVNFTTNGVVEDTSVIQLRAGPFVSCAEWDKYVTSDIQTFFRSSIAQVLGNICKCSYDTSLLSGDSTECSISSKPAQAYGVYRTTLSGTATWTINRMLDGLQQWLGTGPSIRSGITNIAFDSTCPLVVMSPTEPLCGTANPTTSATNLSTTTELVINKVSAPIINKTSGYITTTATCISTYMLIGAMLAELLVLVAVVMLITAIVLCLHRNRTSSHNAPSPCTQQTPPNLYHTSHTSPSSDISLH